jgi:hypothetical protein
VRKEVVKVDNPWISIAKPHAEGVEIWEPMKKTEEEVLYASETERDRGRKCIRKMTRYLA